MAVTIDTSHVLPRTSRYDEVDRIDIRVVPSRKLSSCHRSRCVLFSNFKHIIRGKSRSSTTLSTCTSALIGHVGVVIGTRPKKKMLLVDTRRVVAFVTYKHAVWNWAVRKFPRNSVGHRPAESLADEKNTIPVSVPAASPFNAAINIRCSKKSLKPDCSLCCSSSVLARIRTKPTTVRLATCRGGHVKSLTTRLAKSRDLISLGSRHDAPPEKVVVFRSARGVQTTGAPPIVPFAFTVLKGAI